MFSKKHITILIMGLAIALKSLMIMHYTDIGGDKIYQAAAAVHLAKGKGYTVEVRDPSNPTLSYNKPMMLWPPVYAALLAPLIQAGIAPATATVILDVINGAFFLLLIYWATSLLNFPFLLKMLVLLFKATEINDAIFTLPPTDYLSLNIWLLAILCSVQFLTRGKPFFIWIFILCNALSPWIRYSNIPIILFLPCTFIFLGWRLREKNWIRTGALSLLISGLSVATLLYYNYSRTGSYFYVLETTPGIFPGNLKYLPPLIWMSLININFPLTQLSLKTDLSYAFFMNWLKLTNVFLLITLFYHALRTVSVPAIIVQKSAAGYFFILSGVLSAATVLYLALLSITRSRNFRIDEHWTYIEEHRYMLLVTVTIMLYLIHEFLLRKPEPTNWPRKMLRVFILFIMISETAHGIWIIARKPIHPYDDAALLYGNPLTTKFVHARWNLAKQEGSELILMDEDYNLRGYGLLKGIGIFDDPARIKRISTVNNGKKKILFRLRPGHESLYPFFINPGIKDCGLVERYRFYELNLP